MLLLRHGPAQTAPHRRWRQWPPVRGGLAVEHQTASGLRRPGRPSHCTWIYSATCPPGETGSVLHDEPTFDSEDARSERFRGQAPGIAGTVCWRDGAQLLHGVLHRLCQGRGIRGRQHQDHACDLPATPARAMAEALGVCGCPVGRGDEHSRSDPEPVVAAPGCRLVRAGHGTPRRRLRCRRRLSDEGLAPQGETCSRLWEQARGRRGRCLTAPGPGRG